MLFGLLSIIMDVFKIVSYVGYIHCDSAVKVAFPVVQLVFVFVQVIKKKRPQMAAKKKFETVDETSITVTNCCDLFADILSVDARQGLCASTKEHNTVGSRWIFLLPI